MTDKSERMKQITGSLCRRFKLDMGHAYAAIWDLLDRYTYRVRIDLEPIFMDSVRDLLIRRNNNYTERHKWRDRHINIKYLHKIFRQHLPDWALIV